MRREDQLVAAAAFFRGLLAEDAAGVDIGLANRLFDVLAEAAGHPEGLQYSCAFEESARAGGRWLFLYTPEQVRSAVPVEGVYRLLLDSAELPGDFRGARTLVDVLDAPCVRTLAFGFDARVEPTAVCTRLAVTLTPGEGARDLIERLRNELDLPNGAVPRPESVVELAIEHGGEGLRDVRASYRVSRRAVLADARLRDTLVGELTEQAQSLRLVRGLRRPSESRLVFLYRDPDACEARLAARARHDQRVADLRPQVTRANRGVPRGAGLVVRPCGLSLRLREGRPAPEWMAVLLRPLPTIL